MLCLVLPSRRFMAWWSRLETACAETWTWTLQRTAVPRRCKPSPSWAGTDPQTPNSCSAACLCNGSALYDVTHCMVGISFACTCAALHLCSVNVENAQGFISDPVPRFQEDLDRVLAAVLINHSMLGEVAAITYHMLDWAASGRRWCGDIGPALRRKRNLPRPGQAYTLAGRNR